MSAFSVWQELKRDRKLIATFGLGVGGMGLTWNMETWRKHWMSTQKRGWEALQVLRDRGDFEKLLRATLARGARWGVAGCIMGTLVRPVIFPLVADWKKKNKTENEE